VTGKEFIESCRQAGVDVTRSSFGRVELRGARGVTDRYRRMLQASPDLVAGVMLELCKGDAGLRDLLEERAAIRQADGLPGDLWSAALTQAGVGV